MRATRVQGGAKAPYDFDLRRFGTFRPFLRASERPIAIACLRLVTFFPLRPLRSVPRLRLRIARATSLEALREYRRAILCFLGVSGASRRGQRRRARLRRAAPTRSTARGHGSRALRRATPLPTLRPPDAVKLRGLLLEPRHFLPDQVAVDTVAAQEDLRRTVLADRSRLQHDDPIEAAQA